MEEIAQLTPLLLKIAAIFGGAHVLVVALVGWLSKVWLNRLQELDRQKTAKIIEVLRNSLAKEREEHLEGIKQQYRLLLEQASRRHQLRMAALERRLEVHQQAYTLWRKLVATTQDGQQIGVIVMECQNWWERNCLYLEAEAREAFRIAYMAASQHHQITRGDPEYVEWNLNRIMRPGQLLVQGVELPPISEVEPSVAYQKNEQARLNP